VTIDNVRGFFSDTV